MARGRIFAAKGSDSRKGFNLAIGALTIAALLGIGAISGGSSDLPQAASWRSRHSARRRRHRLSGRRTSHHESSRSTPPRRRPGPKRWSRSTNGHGLCRPPRSRLAAALAMRARLPQKAIQPTEPLRASIPIRRGVSTPRYHPDCRTRGVPTKPANSRRPTASILPRWKRTAAASTPERSRCNCAAGGRHRAGRGLVSPQPAARSERCRGAGRPEQPSSRRPVTTRAACAPLSRRSHLHRRCISPWVTSMPGKSLE